MLDAVTLTANLGTYLALEEHYFCNAGLRGDFSEIDRSHLGVCSSPFCLLTRETVRRSERVVIGPLGAFEAVTAPGKRRGPLVEAEGGPP